MNENKQTAEILDDLNAEVTLAEFVEILRIQKVKDLANLELKDEFDRLPNCLCVIVPILDSSVRPDHMNLDGQI